MRLTGRNGKLRIYDSSVNIMGVAPFASMTIKIVKWDGAVTYTDITSDAEADDGSSADNFVAANDDAVFIGSTSVFSMIKFLKDIGSDYAVASGAQKPIILTELTSIQN